MTDRDAANRYTHPQARIDELLAERDALVGRVETLETAVGPDAAGRPFAELLSLAADAVRELGGGPIEDCLRLKADDLAALAAVPETPE